MSPSSATHISMQTSSSTREIDAVLDEILASTPLPFIKEFLRSQKRGSRKILIGATRDDARRNLRDAILADQISLLELHTWHREIEGWGKQHLYLYRVQGRLSSLTHFLSTESLRGFLKKKGLLLKPSSANGVHPSRLEDVVVDDVYGRLVWRARSDKWERHEELDETRYLGEDGRPDENGDEYVFQAWRRVPTRAASRFCLRKTDGTAIILLTQPLGDDHTSEHANVRDVVNACLGTCSLERIRLAPVIGSLDQNAVISHTTSRIRHGVGLEIQSREARFRADGARVQFESTLHSRGYADSEPVRRVRRAMQVERFVGELGKFRLTYDVDQREHTVVASLDGHSNRSYLYSRMTEGEVWAFVDQLLDLATTT